MEGDLFGIPHLDIYLVFGILLAFGLLEIANGMLRASKRKTGDWIQEAGGFLVLSQLIKPGIVLLVYLLGNSLFPQYSTFLYGFGFIPVFLVYLLVDDLLQYWYHRIAHEKPFLWKLHRAHHQAEEMGFFVSYRNAALYYVFMPNIWWIGLILFLGGAKAVALGLILKQLVIIGSHSTLPWDKVFYKNTFLKPVITILQRIIITPAFHHAHHGKSKLDGVSDPNGNFGNMFSIWDQLFGTAYFNNTFPQEYGLPHSTNDHWSASYFYPFIKSKDETSELNPSFSKEDTSTNEPVFIEIEKGKNYLWCACGKSKTQPFCDGAHHGTKFKPILFEGKKNGKVRLCNCKKTGNPPFCDDSHLG